MGQGKGRGKHVRTSVVIAAVAAIVGASWLLGAAESTTAAPVRVAGLADIPSHNGVYRASMSLDDGRWTVELRTADGSMVDGAAIALEGQAVRTGVAGINVAMNHDPRRPTARLAGPMPSNGV